MIQSKDSMNFSRNASGSVAEVYRRFTQALSSFSDFKNFSESLSVAVQTDSYLASTLLALGAKQADADVGGEAEVFEKGRVVVPLRGNSAGAYLRVAGRRDEKPFGPEDLQLMGAMAGFISALYSQAQAHKDLQGKAGILQFLIDQLPLGVVCFNSIGELISGNSMAWRQLGLKVAPVNVASDPVLRALQDGVGVSGEAHIEVDERLMFIARREFEPQTGERIAAYVIYDMSQRRQRLVDSLDREFYKGRCNDESVVVALLESRSTAGAVYGYMSKLASELGLEKGLIQPVDAYSCACVFPRNSIRTVRNHLKYKLFSHDFEDLRLSFVMADLADDMDSPGQSTLEYAGLKLGVAKDALCPSLLVLEAYDPIFETKEMILEGVARLEHCTTEDAACARIKAEIFDGLFFDLDGFGCDEHERILATVEAAGSGFKIFYTSYKQPKMARLEYGLSERDILLQKPFDAAVVVDAVSLQFNLA